MLPAAGIPVGGLMKRNSCEIKLRVREKARFHYFGSRHII